jgi:hypothetical protein
LTPCSTCTLYLFLELLFDRRGSLLFILTLILSGPIRKDNDADAATITFEAATRSVSLNQRLVCPVRYALLKQSHFVAQSARFKATAEISVSKLFPAGFCWQAMSVAAGSHGWASNSAVFALYTGYVTLLATLGGCSLCRRYVCSVGDAFGVGVGHMAFKLLQKKFSPSCKIDLSVSCVVALSLSSLTLCLPADRSPDGRAPVNGDAVLWHAVAALRQLLHRPGGLSDAVFPAASFMCSPRRSCIQNLGFTPVFFGTGAVCASAFFFGLRLGRRVLGKTGLLPAVSAPDYTNLRVRSALTAVSSIKASRRRCACCLQSDAWLSASIGGASGFFVGTDVTLAGNPFL